MGRWVACGTSARLGNISNFEYDKVAFFHLLTFINGIEFFRMANSVEPPAV